MKFSLIRLALICLVAAPLHGEISPHVITFFIRPLPEMRLNGDTATSQMLPQKQSIPGKMLKTVVKHELNPKFPQAGIFVSYAGTLSKTDNDGQVLFERKTSGVKLQVLITEDIKPVPVDPLNDKTIYGFILNPKAKAQLYQYERLLDPETELYEWSVTTLPPLKEKRVPYDTIIIFANPKHIVVPLGSTITMYSENFVLPDLFVTEHNRSSSDALRFLKIRRYMAPVKFDYQFLKDAYQKKIH